MTARALARCRRAKGPLLVVAVSCMVLAERASAQEQSLGRVRVPTSHANVHMGSSTSQRVLWLAPEGTVLEVVDRRGEWLAVRLTPEMRETGIVMRWYRNEDRGWLHESTVETAE